MFNFCKRLIYNTKDILFDKINATLHYEGFNLMIVGNTVMQYNHKCHFRLGD